MELIPSIDLLGGAVVRLTRGDFATATRYGSARDIAERLGLTAGMRVHVVDLQGSREGRPVETAIVRDLASRGLRVQAGGGVRSIDDARRWFDCGVERLVVGTVAADSPLLLGDLVAEFGTTRIVPAIDLRDGQVRVAGWERPASAPLEDVLRRIEALAIREILVTDIARDGALRGPAFDLYRRLRSMTPLRIIASGGVTTAGDVVSLSRLGNVSGCVMGKALLEGRLTLGRARAAMAQSVPERVIPCLDVDDGRVVKGVRFTGLRDAGDPVACARRYEDEGADEIALLDVSATDDGRATALETVRRVAASVFIPLTVGGGVRSIDDFRALLRAGADRVAINTAAIRRPELIREAAGEFGVQAVVVSCDARRSGDGWVAVTRSGKEESPLDAVEWCVRAARLGAGEILLTSVDRDGTKDGFDIDLLRSVTSSVGAGVIASGGAGSLDHFREAIESGGARAVLAASLFHERRLSIADVKRHLDAEGIPVRW